MTVTDNVNQEYTFCLESETQYTRLQRTIQWLKSNMESLKDSNQEPLFSKVNLGYNENTIKGFGKKPVCDVYLSKTNYNHKVGDAYPSSIVSNIIIYLKGNMNNAYLKACEVNDYIIQEFATNKQFQYLSVTEDNKKVLIINDTKITDSEIRIIPSSKSYGVLVALELTHSIN